MKFNKLGNCFISFGFSFQRHSAKLAFAYRDTFATFNQMITESNVTVMVKDMDSAISFYEKIGLTLKQRWDNHYAMLIAEGITIGLHPAEATNNSSDSVSIGFMVEKIGDAKELLGANNITFKEDDGKSGHYLHFKDPDNTVLYFVEPKWR